MSILRGHGKNEPTQIDTSFEAYARRAKTLPDNELHCLNQNTCGGGRGAHACANCLERESRLTPNQRLAALPLHRRLRVLSGRLQELREIANARFPSLPLALGAIADAMKAAAKALEAENTDLVRLQALAKRAADGYALYDRLAMFGDNEAQRIASAIGRIIEA